MDTITTIELKASPTIEQSQETIAHLENRINQLEETFLEVYPMFCQLYAEIDFAKLVPEAFDSPYSIHSIPIPGTRLNVTFTASPPLLVIGTPLSQTPGPLQWGTVLEIQFPEDTQVVSFRYGGGTGTVEWFGDSGSGHMLPELPALTAVNDTGQFHLARHEGIRRIKITSSGEMYLSNLAVGMA
jgi:hypothetical protein